MSKFFIRNKKSYLFGIRIFFRKIIINIISRLKRVRGSCFPFCNIITVKRFFKGVLTLLSKDIISAVVSSRELELFSSLVFTVSSRLQAHIDNPTKIVSKYFCFHLSVFKNYSQWLYKGI